MRENGEPPWGPTEVPIVEDLLRRIMPPGWACKFISRAVASSIDAPLDNTETPWYTCHGENESDRILWSRRPIWLRKSGSDHSLLLHTFFPSSRFLEPCTFLKIFESILPHNYRINISGNFTGFVRATFVRFRNPPGSTSDLNAKWLICYSRNDNRWITHV